MALPPLTPRRPQVNKLHGPVALVHIDAHLDTWDTYFGAPHTHGTPFRRAAEEKLFDSDCSVHIGIRGPLYSALDLESDAMLGFCVIHCDELLRLGSWNKAKDAGKLRVEGKDYVVADGDVMEIRFNV